MFQYLYLSALRFQTMPLGPVKSLGKHSPQIQSRERAAVAFAAGTAAVVLKTQEKHAVMAGLAMPFEESQDAPPSEES